MKKLAEVFTSVCERLDADSKLTRKVFATVVLIALVLITAGSWRLSQTADEPNHVATGLQWFSGDYDIHAETPPLARIFIAASAKVSGAQLRTTGGPWEAGSRVLYDGSYRRNLALARLGVLPFVLLLAGAVFWLTRRQRGNAAAILAATLTLSAPPILAHAGLATTDIAVTALLMAAFAAAVAVLDNPTVLGGVILGALVGLGVATKFSFMPFWAAAFLSLVVAKLVHRRSLKGKAWQPVVAVLIAAVVATITVWGSYRFSWGTPIDERGAKARFHKCEKAGTLGKVISATADAPGPAPAFWHGLAWLCAHNASGHPAYLDGNIRPRGHASFYAKALAFKTPLALLCLLLGILPLALIRWLRGGPWVSSAATLTALLTVLIATLGNIHIGIRHILFVYPLAAIIIAETLFDMWPRLGDWARALFAVLLLMLAANTFFTHPHHLSYFNALAGSEPGEHLVDSDLDWGQGALLLGDFVREQKIEELSVAYFGTAKLCRHVDTKMSWLAPGDRPGGWIAISEMYFRGIRTRMFQDPCDVGTAYGVTRAEASGYRWLRDHQPVARLDGSIRIYYIEANPMKSKTDSPAP
jgi:4-amino-4-deoxy-L-arabinose transferase-like glycosyltransferase